MTLQEYQLNIHHLRGTANVVADTLSRAPASPTNENEQVGDVIAAVRAGGYSCKEIGFLQHADKKIQQIVLALQGFPNTLSPLQTTPFTLHKGVLYKNNGGSGRPFLLVVPSILRKDILEQCHDSPDGGHRGIEKTLARIRQRFWWKGVTASTKHYVKSCFFCQVFKPRIGLPAGKLRPISPPIEMFHTIGVDHLGLFKTTDGGKQHLIVCIDYLSRWMEAKLVVSTGAEEVIAFLKAPIILHHGPPRRIISDKGPCFTSLAFANFCDRWAICHVQASAEHPETNGLVEKINSSIASTLAAYVDLNHGDWDQRIGRAVFSINTAKQSTTEITPFELVYGRPAVMPINSTFLWPPTTPQSHDERMHTVSRWRKVARRLIIIRHRKSKKYSDRFRKPDPTFLPGELVLIARRPKTKGKT